MLGIVQEYLMWGETEGWLFSLIWYCFDIVAYYDIPSDVPY